MDPIGSLRPSIVIKSKSSHLCQNCSAPRPPLSSWSPSPRKKKSLCLSFLSFIKVCNSESRNFLEFSWKNSWIVPKWPFILSHSHQTYLVLLRVLFLILLSISVWNMFQKILNSSKTSQKRFQKDSIQSYFDVQYHSKCILSISHYILRCVIYLFI